MGQHTTVRVAAVGVLAAAAVVTGGLATPAQAADATVTAKGRFVYVDDTGAVRGIRNARVEMCDVEFPGCTLMAAGYTDTNGNFSITGTAGDWFGDLPDPLVKVIADGPSGVVQTAGAINSTYCFQSGYHDNATNGQTVNYGTISPDSGVTCDGFNNQTDNDDGAWQVFTNVREAWDYINPYTQSTSGRNVPKVRAFWPEVVDSTFYRGPIPGVDEGGISVGTGSTWNEGVIYHEYGHHILQHFAESPWPDYDNGNCDGSWFFEKGHCMWLSEKGSIHWTEGWPDFFGEVLSRYYSKNTTISSVYGNIEDLPHPGAHQDSDFAHVEGYTAAILWDAYDGVRTTENHDGNSSRDRLSAGFGSVWRVVDLYDPKPFDSGRNHVLTIDEFLEGFQRTFPAQASRLAEVYDENHLTGRPAMDLSATAATNPPATVTRGEQITVGDTTRNVGVMSVGEGSQTVYLLSQDTTPGAGDVRLGSRSVGDLGGGGTASSGSRQVSVPSSTSPGSYFVLACADGDGLLFESSEANNCVASNSRLDVEAERPNLRSEAATDLPATVLRGARLRFTDATSNLGRAAAPGSSTAFFLSQDSVVGDDVALAGTSAVPALAVGETTSAEVSVTVPRTTRPGVYAVVSCADDGGAVAESDESDNCAVSSTTVKVVAPDLRVTALSNPPERVVRGGSFRLQDTTKNVGSATARASQTRYWLSADRSRGGDIALDGSRAVPKLTPGATSTGKVSVTVPASTVIGRYFVIACADADRDVREYRESNNCKVSAFKVAVRRS